MYLQFDEMKEITKFASDLGVTRDLLWDLKLHFAERKRSEIDFYRILDRMAYRDSTTSFLGRGDHSIKFLRNGRKHSVQGADKLVESRESIERPSHGFS
jgi:hypothetical protein